MEKADILAFARAVGLERAARDFYDDVSVAAQAAAQARSGFLQPDDPAAEPWPPMQPKDAR
jgi:hypothetical protein